MQLKAICIRRFASLMIRKIDSESFKTIITPTLRRIETEFVNDGHEIRLCGGAVRDLLQEKVPKDIDFATTALPEEMLEMFKKKSWRIINANGLSHGTVTLRLDDENFEITTLRIDVVTDGRRAAVEYTKDWKLDAERRDLTFNSLFLGLDGTLYDYFDGYSDLINQRVRFVGDANTRIQEDYLRILRYFRFFGRICTDNDNHDKPTLECIRANASGLERISGERIWSELRLIILGNISPHLFDTMHQLGLLPYFGLPNRNPECLHDVYNRCIHLKPMAVTVLSALFETEDEVAAFEKRVKFSRNERLVALFIVEKKAGELASKKTYQDILVDSKDAKNHPVFEFLKFMGNEELLNELIAWQIPKFPVSGYDLKAFNIPPGRQVGRIMNQLRESWKQSNYLLSKEELLGKVSALVETS